MDTQQAIEAWRRARKEEDSHLDELRKLNQKIDDEILRAPDTWQTDPKIVAMVQQSCESQDQLTEIREEARKATDSLREALDRATEGTNPSTT
jgi:rubrerythrin